LQNEDAADLRTPLRATERNERFHAAICEAVAHKPKGCALVNKRTPRVPAVVRHASVADGSQA
jgi:cyclic pyranopterin phosphate synthase